MNITNSKVTIYKLEDRGTFVKASIRDARKDKKSGEWLGSFWNAAFFGECAEMARRLIDKDKIEIIRGVITNEKGKDGKVYPSVAIFEFRSAQPAPIAQGNKAKDAVVDMDFSDFGKEIDFSKEDIPF